MAKFVKSIGGWAVIDSVIISAGLGVLWWFAGVVS